jgi:hypothetical protein
MKATPISRLFLGSILARSLRSFRRVMCWSATLALIAVLGPALGLVGNAQEDPLNKVHVQPPATNTPAGEPAGAEAPAATGTKANIARPGGMIRMNVDMVLVPVTVTDPMDRLVTGLEKNDFHIYEDSKQQPIKSFAMQDAPVTIGIIFDLSGSMTSKLVRAKDSILQFIRTANPQDEFFVIGFNDRPELMEDFTNSVDDIQARLANVQAGHRTALLDAIYYGIAKMRDARYQRKALLVVSDGLTKLLQPATASAAPARRSRGTEEETFGMIRTSLWGSIYGRALVRRGSLQDRNTNKAGKLRLAQGIEEKGKDSDAPVVSAPALDALLDLLAVELFFERELGQRDYFGV